MAAAPPAMRPMPIATGPKAWAARSMRMKLPPQTKQQRRKARWGKEGWRLEAGGWRLEWRWRSLGGIWLGDHLAAWRRSCLQRANERRTEFLAVDNVCDETRGQE
jgi:hypothetical protein